MRRDAGPEFPEPTGLSGSYFRWKFRVRLSHPPYCPSAHRIYPCGPETKNGVDTRGGGDERRGRSDRQHQDARLRLVCWALRVRPPRHLRRVARRRRRPDLPVRGPAVWGPAVPESRARGVGGARPGALHRSSDAPGHHVADSRRGDWLSRRLPVRCVARTLLLDHRPHHRLPRILWSGPPAGSPPRSRPGQAGNVGQAEIHQRRRGHHPLSHHLSHSGVPQGHRLLSLRYQSAALLGLRRRVHAGPHAWHMGALGAGGPDGERELRAGDRPDGPRGGGGPAALLLSDPDRRVVRRLCAARTALTSVTERLRASLAVGAARIRRRLTTLLPGV